MATEYGALNAFMIAELVRIVVGYIPTTRCCNVIDTDNGCMVSTHLAEGTKAAECWMFKLVRYQNVWLFVKDTTWHTLSNTRQMPIVSILPGHRCKLSYLLLWFFLLDEEHTPTKNHIALMGDLKLSEAELLKARYILTSRQYDLFVNVFMVGLRLAKHIQGERDYYMRKHHQTSTVLRTLMYCHTMFNDCELATQIQEYDINTLLEFCNVVTSLEYPLRKNVGSGTFKLLSE